MATEIEEVRKVLEDIRAEVGDDDLQREVIRRTLVSQNELFEKMFELQKNQEGDKLEAERESGATKLGEQVAFDKGGFKGKALIFTAIIGAIAGLISGFLQQLTFTFKLVGKFIGGKLGLPRIVNGVKNFTQGIVRVFTQGFKLEGSRALKVANKAGLSGIKRFVFFLGNAMQRIANFFSKTFGFLQKAKLGTANAFSKLANLKIVKGTIDGIRGFFSAIGGAFRLLGGTFKQVSQFTKSAFGIAKSAGKGAKAAGGFFSAFGNVFKTFFTVFQTLGRAIFLPLNIIIGGIGGIIQGFKDFASFEGNIFEKLVAGIFGFVKGAFNAIFGSFFDLIKNGISFLLGKLGFTGAAEFLDSFSFVEIFGKIFDGIRDMFLSIFNGIMSIFQVEGDVSLMKKIGIIIKRMLLFPVAMLAGGVAALAAILPGGKSPSEAFTDTFSKVIKVGEGEAKKKPKVEALSKGQQNKVARSEAEQIEENELKKQSQGQGNKEPIVIDNSTNNNTSNDNSQSMTSQVEEPTNNRRRIAGGSAMFRGRRGAYA